MNGKFVRVFANTKTSKSLYPQASGASRFYSSRGDTETHTGQKWKDDDYRLVRFMDAPKQVNPNWAIRLVAEAPIKKIKDRVVWCDGGSGPEGHPRVYINLDKPGDHSCGYCGLRFVQAH